MEKITSLLDDYIIFDELAIEDLQFLNKKFSQDIDTLTELANYGKSKEFSNTLSNNDKVSLALYGYHIFISDETELKQSVNNFKNYYKIFYQKDDLDVFGIYISYLSKKMFLAKNKIYKSDMPVIISKPLNLRNGIKKIKIIVPIVPTKSPFTIYIISLLNDVIKRLSVAKIDFEIELGWNMCVYNKIVKNLSKHFDFDKENLSFKMLKYYIEQNFRSTVNSLILNSRWGVPNEREIKMNILRNAFEYGREEEYDLGSKEMDSRITHTSIMKPHIWELLLADTKEYSLKEPAHLINYLGTLVENRCIALEEGIIFFITPLPVSLVLYYSLKLIKDKDIENIRRKIYFLCYLPFPGSDDIRQKLPFYLLPYSYYRYQESEKSDDKKIALKEQYVHQLLISCIKRLNTDIFDIPLMEKSFEKMVKHITAFFRNEDNRLNEYMRYI